MAWKVLFLVEKKADSSMIAGLLETEEDEVKSSLDLLVQNGLVITEETEPEKEEVAEEIAEPEKEEVAQEEAEVTEEEQPEDISEEEQPEETSVSEVIEESIVEEEEIEDETVDDIEEEIIETVDEESVSEEIDVQGEQISESTFESALDEGEEEIELLQDPEDDTIQEEVTDSEEEEKIEINIPEGEDEEGTDDLNFNLTGEESAEAPAAEEEKAPPEEEQQEVDTSGYKKILVIDDSLVIRKMVEIALEEEEFNINTAVSGIEGLDIMDKINPDLVILDMMLPDINGIEILKTIKASKGIPVIMLSGKDSPQMIETAKNEGAEEFLPKPFKDDDLVEKIKKLI